MPTTALPSQDFAITDLAIGQDAELLWTVSGHEIDDFIRISGDNNPLHTDDDYARRHGYHGRVAHGMLLGAKVSGLVGMMLPGLRCLLLENKLIFLHPVYVGDNILVRGSVANIFRELSVVELKTKATRTSENKMVARGKALCKILY